MNDILADAEAIVGRAANNHGELATVVVSWFGLTPGQATRAIYFYEDQMNGAAKARHMSPAEHLAQVPFHIMWGILGFCAGSVRTHDELHGHKE